MPSAELNEERGEPIRIIALYTETERHALFVRQDVMFTAASAWPSAAALPSIATY